MCSMNSLYRYTRIWSSLLGNVFEHYDTALFAFLSPFLAPRIFPQESPTTALLLTYAIFPLGLLSRPVGALFFGFLGDRYGRATALFWSLSGIALTSLGIALIPLSTDMSFLAPCGFALGRLLQNFFAAGEIMGGSIFLLENSPPQQHPLLSGLYSSSTLAGGLLASLAVFLLSAYGSLEEGWRYLYLLGALPALAGFWIRRQSAMDLPPVGALNPPPLRITLWTHRNALCRIALMAGLSYASYSIALVLLNGFIPLVSACTQQEMMGLNTLLLLFDFLTLPLFGWLATRTSPSKLMQQAALLMTLSAIPLCFLLDHGSFPLIVIIRLLFVLLGVAFSAPFYSWAQEELPASSRYTLLSLGYALGSQLLGSPTAMISLKLFEMTGHSAMIALYWSLLALAATWALQKRIKQPVHARHF